MGERKDRKKNGRGTSASMAAEKAGGMILNIKNWTHRGGGERSTKEYGGIEEVKLDQIERL